jgi:subtilase family serine protease
MLLVWFWLTFYCTALLCKCLERPTVAFRAFFPCRGAGPPTPCARKSRVPPSARPAGPLRCTLFGTYFFIFLLSLLQEKSVDVEFAKIAARGVTLVGASGDQGAPGDNFYQCQPGLSDIMPASSLWVTAVGATQLGSKTALRKRKISPAPEAQPYDAPICRSLFHPFGVKCADGAEKHEITCSYAQGALITSGGGFQAYLAQPSWQRSAVQSYLAKAKLPSSQYFNASNRAFPDVSALGHEYLVFDQGFHEAVDGTSASTPVLGAMVALWNAQRAAAGKTTLGHVAPLLYAAFAKDVRAILTGLICCFLTASVVAEDVSGYYSGRQ